MQIKYNLLLIIILSLICDKQLVFHYDGMICKVRLVHLNLYPSIFMISAFLNTVNYVMPIFFYCSRLSIIQTFDNSK